MRSRSFFVVLSWHLISCDKHTVSDWSNRKIDNIDSHLRDTKRNDEIESFHSEECVSNRETKSKTHNRDRLLSRKAQFDHGNSFRDAHPRGEKLVYGLKSQSEKQGMVYEDSNDQWISSLNSPSKFVDSIFLQVCYIPPLVCGKHQNRTLTLSVIQYSTKAETKPAKHRRLRKKSPSTPPQITNCTNTRKTRSSSKADAADGDGGVITIDSSSDDGDDASIDASNNPSSNKSEVRPFHSTFSNACQIHLSHRIMCSFRRPLWKGEPH